MSEKRTEERADERADDARFSLERVAQKLKVYAGAILLLTSSVSAASTWLVKSATSEVRNELREIRRSATSDSVRFEQTRQLVELAVIALAEAPESDERRSAVAELRRRRSFTPRPWEGR